MIARMLASVVAIFLFFGGWMLVQHAGRRFAGRHPHLGPFREEGGGCDKACACLNGGHCVRNPHRASSEPAAF
jgi:hypothetical protein